LWLSMAWLWFWCVVALSLPLNDLPRSVRYQNAAGATNDVTQRAFTVFCESLPVQVQSRGRKTAAGVMVQCTTRPLTDAGCNLLTIRRVYAGSAAVALAM